MLGLNYLAWIGIVSWISVPLLALLTAVLLWRRSPSALNKGLAVAVGFGILSMPALISNGVKAYYDRQVRQLCAKDGGVRVYEAVRLSTEEFDELRRVNFVLPDKSQAKQTDEYYYETDRYYYRQRNPEVSRSQHRIVRRSDGKVLGELVRYGRGGGDLPGPWHGSSFMCPDPVRQPSNLETTIFVKGDEQ